MADILNFKDQECYRLSGKKKKIFSIKVQNQASPECHRVTGYKGTVNNMLRGKSCV